MSFTTNISKTKLSGKNIGIYFGSFSPMHVGHQAEIYKALIENDGLILLVSGYDGDRGDKIGLDLQKRFRYLREAFNDEPNIYVGSIDENNIPRYPDGWTKWLESLMSQVDHAVTETFGHDYTFYVGEDDYVKELRERTAKFEDGNTYHVVKSDRSDIQISATMIREHPMAHWNYINRVFRRHFTKKVLVVGSASTGKSTLIRRLSRSINAPFSEEYARTYEEESNVTDEELDATDYMRFIQGQYDANSKEINSPSNNGIVFLDTDAIVTRVYAQMGLTDEENAKMEPFFQDTIANEKFDLILVIPPITEYVDDGFRDMSQSDDDTRWDFHNRLMAMLKEFGFEDKIEILDDRGGERDEMGFYARFNHAKQAVQNRLGVDMSVMK